MKVFLLGATGRVGEKILKNALDDNHQVTVLVRSPDKITMQSPYLIVLEGNALNEEDLEYSMAGADVVISALNTDKNDTLSRSMPLITKTMEQHGIDRIITVGTAGILDSRTEPDKFRFQSNESKRRITTAAEDHLAAYQTLAQTDLDWTVVCPTYLPDGAARGEYRIAKNVLPQDGKQISVDDTADFVYGQLYNYDFFHNRVGIAY